MIDYQRIYRTRADQYDLLVRREDYQGNILPALRAIRSLQGLDVVELGAGTGRLTRLLAPLVHRALAIDISQHMLETAQGKLAASDCGNCCLAVADNRNLPAASKCADLAIAGWSLGHYVSWFPNSWPQEIGRTVTEMKRVLRPGGTMIILETLGTGRETPQPPGEGLATYYGFLESEVGCSTTWLRTDYRFRSVAEAERLARFFFGDELADMVASRRLTVLPECTGIWWLTC